MRKTLLRRRTMVDDLKRLYPRLVWKHHPMRLGYIVECEDRCAYIDARDLDYRAITHLEENGQKECKCEVCGDIHSTINFEEVVDIPVNKLTSKQRKGQRKYVTELLERINEKKY